MQVDQSQIVQDWLQTPLGQALLLQEARVVEEALDGIFGEECLQLGVWGENRTFTRFARTQRCAVIGEAGIGSPSAVGEFHQLPVESDSIDAVLLPHTLDYNDRPHEVLREVDRVLRANGQIVILGFLPFGLLWHTAADSREIGVFFVRLDENGNTMGETVALSEELEILAIELIWTGTEYAAAWKQYNSDGRSCSVYFANIESSGTIARSAIQVNDLEIRSVSNSLGLTWDGLTYSVTWINLRPSSWDNELYLIEISSDGERAIEPVVIDLESVESAGTFSLYRNASEYGVTWVRQLTLSSRNELVFGRIPSSEPFLGEAIVLIEDLTRQQIPSIYWDRDHYSVLLPNPGSINGMRIMEVNSVGEVSADEVMPLEARTSALDDRISIAVSAPGEAVFAWSKPAGFFTRESVHFARFSGCW